MPGYTRHQLKHDRFTDATKETVSWAVGHQKKLVVVTVCVVLIAAAFGGGWYYLQGKDEAASLALGKAVRIYQRPIRPAGTPPSAEFPSYSSIAERGRAAQKEFLAIAEDYKHTRSGEIAHYLGGVAATDAGDSATAERELKQAAGSRRDDLAALAKMALAALYRSTNREAEALKLYTELAEHPTTSVSKAAALFAKADLLQASQPAEAARIYQQIRTEDPTGRIGRMAQERLNSSAK